MENYEDLAFKPEMTFEELAEWAGGDIRSDTFGEASMFILSDIVFDVNGFVFKTVDFPGCFFSVELFKNRTPEQMKQIIIAGGLRDE